MQPRPLSASPIRVTASTGQVYVIHIPHCKEPNCRGKYSDVSITTRGPPASHEQEVLHQELCARESCSVENPPGGRNCKDWVRSQGASDKSFYFPRPYLQLCKTDRCPPGDAPGVTISGPFQETTQAPVQTDLRSQRCISA